MSNSRSSSGSAADHVKTVAKEGGLAPSYIGYAQVVEGFRPEARMFVQAFRKSPES